MIHSFGKTTADIFHTHVGLTWWVTCEGKGREQKESVCGPLPPHFVSSLLQSWLSLGNTSWRVKRSMRSFWKQLVWGFFFHWCISHKWMNVSVHSFKRQISVFGHFNVAGLLNAKTDHKVITEVVQDGNNFTWTQTIPNWTWSNQFSVGQECELATMTGSKFKVS